MMKYRRYFELGGTYFFTLVTYHRKNIFSNKNHILLFIESLNNTRLKHPFDLLAYIILPDHIHMIWKLPENDDDFPLRIRLVKSNFSRKYTGFELPQSTSRSHKKERMIWQRRYWEHYIRNENDLKNHTEYIFYNPVKHGYTISPYDWKYGNFQSYVESGLYEKDWGSMIEPGYFKDIDIYD